MSLPSRLITYLARQGEVRSRVGLASIGASASGACPRQRAYIAFLPHLAEPLTPAVLARFRLGDVVHESLRKLLLAAQVDLSDAEARVNVPISLSEEEFRRLNPIFAPLVRHDGVLEIPGHIDGLLLAYQHEGHVADVPLEIKSVGAWTWKIAAGMRQPGNGEGVVSQPYVDQNLAYQRAIGAPRGVFLYWCVEKDKEAEAHPTFPFIEHVLPWDELRWSEVEDGWKSVLCSSAEQLPERPFAPIPETDRWKPTGRSVLPWQCGYCSFVGTCWPQAKLDPDAKKSHTYVMPQEA